MITLIKRHRSTLAKSGIVLLCLLAVSWLVLEVRYDLSDVCIRSEQSQVESGSIHSVGGGLFGSGNIMHTVYYPGICKLSGKSCLRGVNVTQSEYERLMYGN